MKTPTIRDYFGPSFEASGTEKWTARGISLRVLRGGFAEGGWPSFDCKNKSCNLKIKPVMVLCTFSHGFQAPQLRRFLFSEREGLNAVGWLFQAVMSHSPRCT